MKNKYLKLVLSAIIVSILLIGCQTNTIDKSQLIGKMNCLSVNSEPVEEGVECYIEFNEDDTYLLAYNGHGYNFAFPGDYRIEGEKIYLSGFYDGKGNKAEQECTFDGNKLTYKELQTDFIYVFEK